MKERLFLSTPHKPALLWALAMFMSVLGHAQSISQALPTTQAGTDMALSNANALLNKTAQEVLFMENRGQVLDQNGRARPDVLFMAKSGGTKVALRANGISYQFEKNSYKAAGKQASEARPHGPDTDQPEIESVASHRLDMYLEGANPAPEVVREAGSDYMEHYYNIPSAPQGITGVRAWTRIRLKEIYPGIDWLIYAREGGIKYDFIVRPGADPAQIRMRYAGGADLRIDRSGALTVKTPLGEISEQAPVSYQDGREIPSRFVLDGQVLTLAFTGYDPARTLIVDPLVWATYYGGTGEDVGFSTAVDGSGNAYLAGLTSSGTGITSNGHQNANGGGSYDAFLVKFNASGARQWATYYGGTGDDRGWSTAVDGSGNAYLAGITNSTSGIAAGGHQNANGGGNDAYLVKFNASGTRQWATYYGVTGHEQGNSTAVDRNGNVYLAGFTNSTSGIASGGHQNANGGSEDAFLVKFNASGARQWATYYGGTGTDQGNSTAVDGSGNAYLAGATWNSAGIASGGHQNINGGSTDAFLVKFNASGTRQWATYYGGTGDDRGQSTAVDGSGNAYLAGYTNSTSGIASVGHQHANGGGNDAFLVKFNASGARQWATYYGGPGDERGHSTAVDRSGNVYLASYTGSSTDIASGGHQHIYGGGDNDAYLVKFNASGAQQWATYYGGTGTDQGLSTAVDGSGNAYLAGFTKSTSGLASNGHQNANGGGTDAFLAKFDGNASVKSTPPAPATPNNYIVEMLGRRGTLEFPASIQNKPTTAKISMYGLTKSDVKTYNLSNITWSNNTLDGDIRDAAQPSQTTGIFSGLDANVNSIKLYFPGSGKYQLVGALKATYIKDGIYSGNNSTIIVGYSSETMSLFPPKTLPKHALIIRDKHAGAKDGKYDYAWYVSPTVPETNTFREIMILRDDLLKELALYEFANVSGSEWRKEDEVKKNKVLAYDLSEIIKQIKVAFPKSDEYGLKTKLKSDIMALLITEGMKRYPSTVFGLKSTGHGTPIGIMNEFLDEDYLIERSLLWTTEIRKKPIDFIDLNTNCNAGSFYNMKSAAPYTNYILASDLTRYPTNSDDYQTFFNASTSVQQSLINILNNEDKLQKECEGCKKFLMQASLFDAREFKKVVDKIGPDAVKKVKESVGKPENKNLIYLEETSKQVDFETAVPRIFPSYTTFASDWKKVLLKKIDNRSYVNTGVAKIPEAKGLLFTRIY